MQKENEELREQLASIPTRKAPDAAALEAAKSKVLNKFKVGAQSSVGKALDALVKDLKRT